jgi:hypothetical protein
MVPYLLPLRPFWSRCILLVTDVERTDLSRLQYMIMHVWIDSCCVLPMCPITCIFYLKVYCCCGYITVSNISIHCYAEFREHIQRDNPVLPCFLSDVKSVKLLRLGCRSSACGFRRVPTLLVFYSSFGSQNIVQCRSQCIKMPPIMPKLKRENVFSKSIHAQTESLLSYPPPPSYCDVAKAWSYFWSTVIDGVWGYIEGLHNDWINIEWVQCANFYCTV